MSSGSLGAPSGDSNSGQGYSVASFSQLQSIEGYEYEFDPPVDSRYECPVCLLVLREPSQTKCGHRFCRECILRTLKNSSSRCPIDNEPLTEADIYPDNYAKREILNCTIKCPNREAGCEKVFPLCELKVGQFATVFVVKSFTLVKNAVAHLQDCQFTLIPCPNKCGSILPRRDINKHVEKHCGLRIVMCTCCGANIHAQLAQEHIIVCPKVPVKCEHCPQEMTRDMLNHHLQTACENVTVLCPFYPLGCGSSLKRRNENKHLMEDGPNHLRQLCGAVTHILAQMNVHKQYLEQIVENSDLSRRESLPSRQQQDSGACLTHTTSTVSGLSSPLNQVVNNDNNNSRRIEPQSQPAIRGQHPVSHFGLPHNDNMAPSKSISQLSKSSQNHQRKTGQNTRHPSSLPSCAANTTKQVRKPEASSLPFLDNVGHGNVEEPPVKGSNLSTQSHQLAVDNSVAEATGVDILAATVAGLNLQSSSSSAKSKDAALQEETKAQELSPSYQSATRTQGSPPDAVTTIPLVFTMMEQVTATFNQKLEAQDKEIAELKSTVSNLKKQNVELSQNVVELQALVANGLSKSYNGKFYWTIQGFRGHKQRALKGELVTLHSHPFYTSMWGYKMCLRANITSPQIKPDRAPGQQFLSLFVHVMQGDNDPILPWPFTGKIMLALLDQNKNETRPNHVQETLEAKPNLAAFQRPVQPRNQKGFGFLEFMPVTTIEAGTYLANDCLLVYAQVLSPAG
ncbi:TNF receptor-associated factor 6 protein [Elysia marginata]|uniref:TNF receptor-associated factor 6 protein n=1 Tax=Elysia marginata TaxID=1093978 RepID=A0AAV4F9X3_9GAST|nr:TNF receptor-associated factor 6 protein [Elysia marginata]